MFIASSTSLTAQIMHYKATKYSIGKITGKNNIILLSTSKSDDLIDINLREMIVYISGGQEFEIILVNNKNPKAPMYICSNHTAIKLDKNKMTLSILYDYDLEEDERAIVVYNIKPN